MIQRNRHPMGRVNNMVFGLCAIGDGLVRVLSGGFLHSTFTLVQSRNATRRHIARLKAQRLKETSA